MKFVIGRVNLGMASLEPGSTMNLCMCFRIIFYHSLPSVPPQECHPMTCHFGQGDSGGPRGAVEGGIEESKEGRC